MFTSMLEGLSAYGKAFSVLSELKLWKYFAIPVIISLCIALSVFSVVYGWADDLGGYLATAWPWEFGKETVTTISTIVSGLLIVIIGLLLYKHLVLAFSAPFMSPVSEKIEAHYYPKSTEVKTEANFSSLLLRGVRLSMRNLTREILLTLVLLLLSLIPVIGIFMTVALFLVQAYYAGFGNMDFTLERHYQYKESIQFVKRNKGVAIGNGLVFILFLLIPFIGALLVLPLSVTAATLTTLPKIKAKNT